MIKKIIAIILLAAALTPGERREVKISVAAAGDNLIHSSIYKDALKDGDYDFSPLYEGISDIISGADIAFVNQETTLGSPPYSGYPKFNTPYKVGEALVGAGFDVINVANNHMLDHGYEGLKRTSGYLGAMARVVGDARDDIEIIEKNGVRIAFVSFTYSTNYGNTGDVPVMYGDFTSHLIRTARAEADFVIVSAHWGVEYDTGRYIRGFEPTDEQKSAAREMSEAGADVIIGTHPHVLERVEWLRGNGRDTLVAYSLGNLVSNMRYGKNQLGCILTFDISGGAGGLHAENVRVIPTVCHCNGVHRGYRVYKLSDYTDELASVHGTNDERNELAFGRETLYRYYNDNISEEFREK